METFIKSKTRALLSSGVLIFIIIALAACSNDDDVTITDDGVLRLLKQNIGEDALEEGADNIPVESPLTLIFSHSLNTDELSAALQLSSPNGAADYDLEFTNSNSTVIITPGARFDYETTYTLNIPEGAYGANGEALTSPINFNFKTAAYVPPVIKLSAASDVIKESAETVIVTAELDKDTEDDVIINLDFSGSAVLDTDYTASSSELTIPAGELSTTFEITSIPDQENDDNESIIVSIASIENATDNDNTLAEINITEELPPLSLKGVLALTWDGSDTNDGKAVHVVANADIADLSIYSLGVANNGGGTDGPEYTFPAISLSEGDNVLVARNPAALTAYFEDCGSEFTQILESNNSISQNGDDAIELYSGDTIIEVYGDSDVDGTGEAWEYSGSWAYKVGREWSTGGVDCTVGGTLNSNSPCPYPICKEALEIKGVLALLWDGSGTNGGKAVHFRANKDIEDLSIYGVGITNNGGGTDGVEYNFPQISVEEGDDILLAREPGTIAAYFGDCTDEFEHVFESDSMNQNGDDGVELFNGDNVIETYGDADVDGTGEVWEYSGSWAYKINGDWTTGGIDCADSSTSTQSSACVYPICE
ncbi:Ig-like domain-containing protein [Christiangramia gaetbulicola]|uniref:Ig-like domain-containing protein n=1 Tax=Christiangramia gaetbulicola TaxID=703340 RepID=A0A2T6ACC5_9FLAO|nr:Ig-like domain-containing protein [Christiangramia gaetbulicola]PTX41446.1 Ig-like domain-containing protein [Christiangramia gaetbulicola]